MNLDEHPLRSTKEYQEQMPQVQRKKLFYCNKPINGE